MSVNKAVNLSFIEYQYYRSLGCIEKFKDRLTLKG